MLIIYFSYLAEELDRRQSLKLKRNSGNRVNSIVANDVKRQQINERVLDENEINRDSGIGGDETDADLMFEACDTLTELNNENKWRLK